MFSAGIVGITYILIVTACAHDDRSKADMLFNSLPIHRYQVVISKYSSILVYAAIGMVEYFMIEQLVMIIGIPLSVAPLSFESIIGALFAVVLMNSIYLPLFFKYGYIKSKIVSFILFFAFFFGASTIAGIAENTAGHNNSIKVYIIDFMSQPDSLLATELFLIMIITLLSSILLSIKFYNNRDF